ncbi:MAG: winged helix-turn-helix transcriptional regulator [Clostridia bacterium]|nr:winged helix-turn-helix transcriptional regulator [Clostridia bacterium]
MPNTILISQDSQLATRLAAAANQCGLSPIPFRREMLLNPSFSVELAIVDTHAPWSRTQAMLSFLAERGVPVLFVAPSNENAPHLRHLYKGPCQVVLSKETSETVAERINELLQPDVSAVVARDLHMDLMRQSVTRSGEVIGLTAQEFRLLRVLMENPNQVMSRSDLLRDAWDFATPGITRVVDNTIQRLLKKLGDGYIDTVSKKGYVFRDTAPESVTDQSLPN